MKRKKNATEKRYFVQFVDYMIQWPAINILLYDTTIHANLITELMFSFLIQQPAIEYLLYDEMACYI